MPYADAKVEATLCKFISMKYELKCGSVLRDDWLLGNAVPNILKVCGKEVALIFHYHSCGMFLHETKEHFVRQDIFEQIIIAY